MKVTAEEMERCQAALSIEIEPGELEESRTAAYRRLANKTSIAGFRKGKAPRAILEQHLGKDTLTQEALEHLIPRLYKQAVESQGLEPIASPQIEITQDDPVVFRATLPLKPKVELGDYHSTRLKPEPVAIGDKEVEAALEGIRHEQAVLRPVDRPVQFDDFVTLDIEANIEGTPILSHKGVTYEVSRNSALPLPGFADNVAGMEKNQEKVFTLSIPKDHRVEKFSGKECLCKTSVSEVKEQELPELGDELAQSMGHDSLVSLREKVAADLTARAEEKSQADLRQRALAALVELSSVDYPPILEQREIEQLLQDEARRFGYIQVEDFIKRTGKTREELEQQLQPVAKKRVTNALALDRVAEQEEIEISPSEVDNRVEEVQKNSADKEKVRQFLSLPQVRESIEQSLRTDKTLDRLVQIASESKRARRTGRSSKKSDTQ